MLSQRLTTNNPLFNNDGSEDEGSVHTNPFARRSRHGVERRHDRHHHEDVERAHPPDQRWESSFKVEIPEFHGRARGEALLDWITTVDELLELKQVPEQKWLSLVAMKFRGHAASWWKQVKLTRHRTGKPPIMAWEKLQKHLKATFLPHNYAMTVYI